ncbi:MAG: efflux transporter outer membrane subunit [Gemmataceae bacterium]
MMALSLCGCTTLKEYIHNGFKVGPNYRRPPAPVAEHWIDEGDQRLRTESCDGSQWWTVFNDPVLNDLVQIAYEQNLTLREAGFRVLQARARVGFTIGRLFPQSQFANGGFTQQGLSEEVANRTFLPERFFGQFDLGFVAAWELDYWGRFRRAVEAAKDVLDASVEAYDDALVTLLGDVAFNYVQLRSLEEQIRLTRANVQLQRVTLDIAQAKFKGGETSELDVDQAQSVLSQTESFIPQLEIQLREVNNRLCVLLGIPPEELRCKLGPAPIPVAPPEICVGIPAELIQRRPDVRRAEREAAAECARIGIAESEFYPAITVTGTIGWSAENFSDLFNERAWRASIGPAFRWNILNYGRIKNLVRLQDARFQEAVVAYQNTVLQAGEDVENGIVRFLRSHQRRRYLAESVQAAEKAVKVALAQYKAGLVDFNRVALLEQNLVQQQISLVQAEAEIAQGLVLTYRALGGGWQIRCDPCGAPAAGAMPESADSGELLPPPKPVPVE